MILVFIFININNSQYEHTQVQNCAGGLGRKGSKCTYLQNTLLSPILIKTMLWTCMHYQKHGSTLNIKKHTKNKHGSDLTMSVC